MNKRKVIIAGAIILSVMISFIFIIVFNNIKKKTISDDIMSGDVNQSVGTFYVDETYIINETNVDMETGMLTWAAGENETMPSAENETMPLGENASQSAESRETEHANESETVTSADKETENSGGNVTEASGDKETTSSAENATESASEQTTGAFSENETESTAQITTEASGEDIDKPGRKLVYKNNGDIDLANSVFWGKEDRMYIIQSPEYKRFDKSYMVEHWKNYRIVIEGGNSNGTYTVYDLIFYIGTMNDFEESKQRFEFNGEEFVFS